METKGHIFCHDSPEKYMQKPLGQDEESLQIPPTPGAKQAIKTFRQEQSQIILMSSKSDFP